MTPITRFKQLWMYLIPVALLAAGCKPDAPLSAMASDRYTPTISRPTAEAPANTPLQQHPTQPPTYPASTLTPAPTHTSEPTPTSAPSQSPTAEPTTVPDSITYKVEQTFKIYNQGPASVSTLRLTAAKIQSIAPYQKVHSFEVDPALDYKDKVDELGNQFLEFQFANLSPEEELQFTINYKVEAFRERAKIDVCEGELPAEFTQPEKFIESDAEQILDLSRNLSTGAVDACQRVRAFYDFVAENIEYVPDCTTEDRGALNTLKYRSGDCTEFSDLLIALARSAGIPARFVEGVVPDEGHEKHDWAHVYLPGPGWVTMEPTWGRIDGLREVYFAGTTPDHIILTIGRNLEALNGKHYWSSCFYWDESLSQPLVKIDSDWDVIPVE